MREMLENSFVTKKEVDEFTSLLKTRDHEVNQLRTKLSELSDGLTEKDAKIAFLETKLKESEALIDESIRQIAIHEENIANLNMKLKIKDNLINEHTILINGLMCSLRIMELPDIKPFLVTYNDNIAGPGWIVMLRRVDGSVDFEKDMSSYVEGFGEIQRDFWLGLDKLHRLTVNQRHELYIHIVDYEDETHFARYDHFIVGSKDEEYRLKSLGKYFGNAGDMMRISEKMSFWVCPKFKNGWWDLQKGIPHGNLTGRFSRTRVDDFHYLYWGLGKWGKGRNNIKYVQMLIRSKSK
ncbi:maker786 [Drosophila busckii]|uniref:Maker786 n=2 Tax=Drosophila busckii TaxID=30019 RepID=A0A0M4EGH0_DROBS|nr:maker786 [Drosophila busckii]